MLDMQTATLPEPTHKKLPRWRGFNLLEKFNVEWSNKHFVEKDFEWIAELGFNFVRLPMDYRVWIDNHDWTKFHEPALKEVDEAVKWGEKYRIHVQINFHRAPGFTVASPSEDKNLWTDEEAQKICALHWSQFAKRYQGLSNRQVSFNLFNEPFNVGAEPHKRVVQRVADAIWEHDPRRLIVCDGREYGTIPAEELIGMKVAQATRGYAPFTLTHYKAEWVPVSMEWQQPTKYPHKEGDILWDKNTLWERQYRRWKELEAKGVGVMVGEFGAYNKTPHHGVIAWMRDLLALWKEANWGWALWNFRGAFGVLDSGRTDVTYENWRGHQLDREMLELLRSG